MKRVINSAKQLSRGVFWDVDGELLAFPFVEGDQVGVAKTGLTYNHKNLWPHIKPKGCNKGFDYYPRGRVEIGNRGQAIIWMNANVSDSLIPKIRAEFGIIQDPEIKIDGSDHYKCHLDDGYEPQK